MRPGHTGAEDGFSTGEEDSSDPRAWGNHRVFGDDDDPVADYMPLSFGFFHIPLIADHGSLADAGVLVHDGSPDPRPGTDADVWSSCGCVALPAA